MGLFGLFGPPDVSKMKANHDVKGLLKALAYQKDLKVRIEAAEALARMPDPRPAEPLAAALVEGIALIHAARQDAIRQAQEWEALVAKFIIEGHSRILGDVEREMGKPDHERAVRAVSEYVRHLIRALGKTKDESAVEVVAWGLDDPSPDVREEATRTLGELGGFSATHHLGRMLNAKEESLRKAALNSLGKIGAPSADVLIAALGSSYADVRIGAAERLGATGDSRAVGPLSRMLGAGEESLRRAALNSLGKIGAPSVDALITALGNANPDVRAGATNCLGEIGDRRAVDPLMSALRRDGDDIVRASAADALGELGDPRALQALINAARGDSRSALTAVTALGDLGPVAVDALISLARDGSRNASVRARAIGALGRVGDRRAEDAAIAGLRDGDSGVVYSALGALAKLGSQRSVGPLIDVLRSRAEEQMQTAAAKLLGALGHPAAVDALIGKVQGHASREVRKVAAEALVQLYRNGLDADGKRKILAARDAIARPHQDTYVASSDCSDGSHTDQGTGVRF